MVNSDQVLDIIKQKGPSIPSDISHTIGQNIMITSAILSELSSKSKVIISNVKIGGSPLYYIAGQEELLQKFSTYLHEKENKAFEMLKEKKVVEDTAQDPVIRVALRNIKDFAKPIQVSVGDETKLFWKWYLISNEQASEYIGPLIGVKQEPKPDPVVQEKPEIKQEIKQEPEKQEAPKEEVKYEESKKEERSAEQAIIKEKPAKSSPSGQDDFLDEIKGYFAHNNISVKEIKVIKKNKEVDFVISMSTPVGDMDYFVKAKSSKRVAENDLSACFARAQIKKLPAILLITGDLTKKTKELHQEEFASVIIKKI